jgi:hypothetical protein
MGSRKSMCQCYLDHSDVDEMCDPCREKHLDRMIDHQEFLRESRRDEIMIDELLQEIGVCT